MTMSSDDLDRREALKLIAGGLGLAALGGTARVPRGARESRVLDQILNSGHLFGHDVVHSLDHTPFDPQQVLNVRGPLPADADESYANRLYGWGGEQRPWLG